MTAPDLPAELKAALDARLQGLSRNDAAARAALISKTYRDGGGSAAIRSRDRRAGLCAGADAGDLCRGDREPERARAKSIRTSRPKACSMSAPGRERRAGPRRKRFRRCGVSRCSMPTAPCARWRSISPAAAARLRECNYAQGEARAALARGRAGRPRGGELHDRRDRRGGAKRARRADVGKDPRHAVDRRARHARGLRPDHRRCARN